MGNLLHRGKMLEKWIDEFKRGRRSANDAQRMGRPKDVTTPEVIEKTHDIVFDDPKVKMCELAETAGISFWSLVKSSH